MQPQKLLLNALQRPISIPSILQKDRLSRCLAFGRTKIAFNSMFL
jgi:hypothetical protein